MFLVSPIFTSSPPHPESLRPYWPGLFKTFYARTLAELARANFGPLG